MGVGSSLLFWEASGYMEEVENLSDTSHSQSCKEVAVLCVKDSKTIFLMNMTKLRCQIQRSRSITGKAVG